MTRRSQGCPPRGRRGISGFTLIELLVAVALMAVLAILCWRGLDSVVRSRDRLNAASDELRALTAAFTQLDDDLRRSWPVRLFELRDRLPISFSRATQDGPVALEMLRETGSREEALRLQAVVYRLRDGQLERGFVPWQTGFGVAEPRTADQPVVWQPLLSDVAGFEIRAWIEERKTWIAAGSLVGAALGLPAARSAASAGAEASTAAAGTSGAATAAAATAAATAVAVSTVTGLEVALARRNGGRIVRVFSVKD